MRMLAYGVPVDAIDEYLHVGETIAIQCLHKFATGIIMLFGDEYLRRPNEADVQRLLQIGEARGFPCMMGSIDCMHWVWKNCLKAWHGQSRSGHHGDPSLILETIAGPDLWIWHSFFGVAGSNKEINVLQRSLVFDDLLNDVAPKVNFNVNRHDYDMGYYLANGIYPQWTTFIKTILRPKDDKSKLFAKYQEGARKDVERAFGVLQTRFVIICGHARGWSKENLGLIMNACFILYNMIVEDERDTYSVNFDRYMNKDISSSYEQVNNVAPTDGVRGDDFAPYTEYVRNSYQTS